MHTITQRAAAGVAAVGITGLLAFGAPAAHGTETTASATAHATAQPCGYDGRVNGQPTYNHCGHGSVIIKVDHMFWQHTYACMPRGVHAIPQGEVSWVIIGAEFDGHTCTYTTPVAVGPDGRPRT